jgi:hypothetical protein
VRKKHLTSGPIQCPASWNPRLEAFRPDFRTIPFYAWLLSVGLLGQRDDVCELSRIFQCLLRILVRILVLCHSSFISEYLNQTFLDEPARAKWLGSIIKKAIWSGALALKNRINAAIMAYVISNLLPFCASGLNFFTLEGLLWNQLKKEAQANQVKIPIQGFHEKMYLKPVRNSTEWVFPGTASTAYL